MHVSTFVAAGSGSLSEDKVWKRSMQSVIREALLCEKDMQAASDKAAFWVSGSLWGGHIIGERALRVSHRGPGEAGYSVGEVG